MNRLQQFDKASFPGGYDIVDIMAAVTFASMRHVKDLPPPGETKLLLMETYLRGLVARHPDIVRNGGDPYEVRNSELFDQRGTLVHSHLAFSWFNLAYWLYGLMAIRCGLSAAKHSGLAPFLIHVRGALRELGVAVSDDECLAEVDRFVPAQATPRNVEAAAMMMLSFFRFLHFAALRRREVVTPDLMVPTVCLVFAAEDADEARLASAFLTSHAILLGRTPAEVAPGLRLLVLLSPRAMISEVFWRSLAEWKDRGAIPMVVCLMPKSELYREPPADSHKEVWTWLAANVAVELGPKTDRYVNLLRALDSVDSKQWWWNPGDAVELGLAVDVLALGIPRPAKRREAGAAARGPYPYTFDDHLLGACLVASDRLTRDEANGRDARYFAFCSELLPLRKKPNGEPYTLPWFMLIYRAWLSFAGRLPGFAYSEEDIAHSAQEFRSALFALGIGREESDASAFVEAFANLPWTSPAVTIAAVDERACAFIVLVHHLSQAALARTQRMRLQQPPCSSFISYARPDEGIAREIVAHLEAKGADVWWDRNAITLGTPLDGSLRSAVGDSRYLLLVATSAAAASPYVRLEVEAALREGLRIVPICPETRIPGELRALLDSAPDAVEPAIVATDAARAGVEVLARLARSPSEQLRWLQCQARYENLARSLAQMRARIAKGGES